ncbi:MULTISPECIES: S26 family signal peptidase [unclassified Mesorhizobium]|uniref:S26 family signal peptidase n=1 Tax=unclassified Mesorhizobium TaxID=325217 RepID=UPI0011290890|nr:MULTISPECIES: S26 family signal peptidase [unclassified Mesorhizobium]TPK95300.1 S26 family signal peptidase [Mesorhizobium sp. B2-4-16]TPL60995.1 S26 family signal peptidase [Mesorhizobium sp. B2-4-3]
MSARRTIVAAMLAGAALAVAPAWSRHGPWLIWNASASVPIGLYRVEPGRALGVGDLAVVMPPEPLAELLAERRYLPRSVSLLKRVLALGGEAVCRSGLAVTVRGVTYGYARERDSRGRPLPTWQGCRVIGDSELFLMNRGVADSFDGRYFGPLPMTAVVGRAVPVWTNVNTSPAPHLPVEPSSREP